MNGSLLSILMSAPQGKEDGMGLVVWMVIGILGVIVTFFVIYAMRYRKVGPNEVLVVSGGFGRKMRDASGKVTKIGFRWVKGGGTFVWPVLEQAQLLSLELMTIDVKTNEVYSITGVPVTVEGVAQVKVKGDDISIITASEQFLSKTVSQIMHVALETLEGHLRAIIGQLTVEEIYKDRDAFAIKVADNCSLDFANMGMQIVSFTVKDVRDSEGYLDALGKPRVAQVKRDAIIGQAEADRDATIKSSEAHQAAQDVKYKREAMVAEAQRDYEMKRAEYQASVNTKKAASDLAYNLQKYKTDQAVKVEEMRVLEIEKGKMVEIKVKDLQATVEKPAEAEKNKIQALAEAERFKTETEASGRANATRNVGVGEADANKARGLAEAEIKRAQGLAEAEVILAKGNSEAEAMQKKAAAWQNYNEAAIAQMLIERLPDLARAIAEPLARTDRITIVSTGDGEGTGASKITGDIVKIIAQLPPILEGVSGINLKDLLSRLPSVSGGTAGKQQKK